MQRGETGKAPGQICWQGLEFRDDCPPLPTYVCNFQSPSSCLSRHRRSQYSQCQSLQLSSCCCTASPQQRWHRWQPRLIHWRAKQEVLCRFSLQRRGGENEQVQLEGSSVFSVDLRHHGWQYPQPRRWVWSRTKSQQANRTSAIAHCKASNTISRNPAVLQQQHRKHFTLHYELPRLVLPVI